MWIAGITFSLILIVFISYQYQERQTKKTIEKIQFDGIEQDISNLSFPDFESLTDLMVKYSDSVIISSDRIDKSTLNSIKSHSKKSLNFKDSSNDEALMKFLLENTD